MKLRKAGNYCDVGGKRREVEVSLEGEGEDEWDGGYLSRWMGWMGSSKGVGLFRARERDVESCSLDNAGGCVAE